MATRAGEAQLFDGDLGDVEPKVGVGEKGCEADEILEEVDGGASARAPPGGEDRTVGAGEPDDSASDDDGFDNADAVAEVEQAADLRADRPEGSALDLDELTVGGEGVDPVAGDLDLGPAAEVGAIPGFQGSVKARLQRVGPSVGQANG